MYIIDDSYFIKQYAIPNSNEVDISNTIDPFVMWIDSRARLCLQLALGNVLFSDFDSNVSDGALKSTAPDKWKNLVNGVSYVKNDKTYAWKGLAYSEGSFKGSLLVPFIYAEWLKDQVTRMSGVGEVKGNAANSVNANSTERYVSTWNDFVSQYQGNSVGKDFYRLSYPNGVPFYDYFGSDETDYVSLITFLNDNETDYPDAKLKCYEFKNSFGI